MKPAPPFLSPTTADRFAQLEAQDAQERARGRAATLTLTKAANAQGGRE